MNHLPSSVEAVPLGYAARAAAAARDAQACRDMSDQILTDVRVRFTDPLFDAASKLAQHYRDMAAVCDDLADTFERYALADHIEAVA